MKTSLAWCYHHHKYEDTSGETYRSCGECGHVYRRAIDLVNVYNREATYMAEHWAELLGGGAPPAVRNITEDDANHIGFCQYCLHDWCRR